MALSNWRDTYLIVFAQVSYFLTMIFFTFKHKVLKHRLVLVCLSSQSNVSHSKQSDINVLILAFTFQPISVTLFKEVRKFLNPFLDTILYIKSLFPTNKQLILFLIGMVITVIFAYHDHHSPSVSHLRRTLLALYTLRSIVLE